MNNSHTCAICGNPITGELSIKRGIGPDCWKKLQLDVENNQADNDSDISIDYTPGTDIILKRDSKTTGGVITNVPRSIYKHSPIGYGWGNLGSGPSDLALNILLLFRDAHFSFKHYQEFKEHFVARIAENGGVIALTSIMQWIEQKEHDELDAQLTQMVIEVQQPLPELDVTEETAELFLNAGAPHPDEQQQEMSEHDINCLTIIENQMEGLYALMKMLTGQVQSEEVQNHLKSATMMLAVIKNNINNPESFKQYGVTV